MRDAIMPNKIVVLFLVFGDAHRESGLRVIRQILTRMFPEIPVDFLVIDNAVPPFNSSAKHALSRDVLLLPGDNSLWEFSGWDKGTKYVLENISFSKDDVFLYVNDTFHLRSYSGGANFIDVFDKPILDGVNVLESAVGYLDDFPRTVTLREITYKAWIRSNIFFLPRGIAERVFPMRFDPGNESIFSSDFQEFWGKSNIISDNWKAYISSWLFGRESDIYPEYRLRWLKAASVSPDNFEFFKKKVLCILSEHWLSARLHDWNVPIIDTNVFDKRSDRHISDYYC